MPSIGDFSLNLQDSNLGLTVLLFVLALVLALFAYRRTFPPLSKRKRALLLGLRMAALFSLFLVLSEPILTLAQRYVHKPVMALLLDASQSMELKGENTTRIEDLKEAIRNRIFEEVSSESELVTFAFSDSLVPLASMEQFPDSLGNATAIGEAIKSIKEKFQDRNLVGMVILSDGVNNLGEDPVPAARSSGVPVFTCGMGTYSTLRDVSIGRINYPDIGYVGDKMTIEVNVSQNGYDQTKIPVSIREKNVTLDQQNLTLGKSGTAQALSLSITPQEAGLHQYQLNLPVMEEESVKENNQRTFAIKVLKSKIGILLVSGNLNWEYTFLKRALEKDENVKLESLVYGKDNRPIVGRFPQGRETLGAFDILMFLDPPGFVLRDHKNRIEEFLSNQGGSVFFLLGKEFLDSHGFLEMSPLLPFDPKGATITFSTAKANLELTEEGKLHPITRLVENSEENEKTWSDLPPFSGLVLLGATGKEATSLAQFKSPTGSASFSPGIVVRNYGKGKILAITVTPFWQWDFLMWGIGKNNQAYLKFWNNCVRWLVVREDMDLVNLHTDKKIYMGGERIEFTAKIFDQNYQKIEDASVVVNVKGEATPDSEMVNLGLSQTGDYVATLGALPPGNYSYQGQVFRDGEKIGTKSGEFLVEQYSLENSDLKTDFDLLKRIAESSGGKYYQKEEIGNLAQDLKFKEREERKEKEIQLWNHPLMLVIFVLCLSVEWAIRKRSQLL